MPLDQESSDDELMELDGFLGSPGLVESSLDVFGLEGFLAAILATSRRVEPSEWTPWIWDVDRGEISREFENAEQAERILGLVMRLYNDVAGALAPGGPSARGGSMSPAAGGSRKAPGTSTAAAGGAEKHLAPQQHLNSGRATLKITSHLEPGFPLAPSAR